MRHQVAPSDSCLAFGACRLRVRSFAHWWKAVGGRGFFCRSCRVSPPLFRAKVQRSGLHLERDGSGPGKNEETWEI